MTDDTTLRIERLIDAPPEVVFHAWTTSEAMEQWYRDGDDFVAASSSSICASVGVTTSSSDRKVNRRTSRPARTWRSTRRTAS